MNSISVLMCVYEKDNDSHFIEALKSLKLNKNFIDQTIIVINGYISKIKKKEIIKNYQDLKINLIELPINLGLSRALNLGLAKVKSDWIARFDSDDICLPERFKMMKKSIEINKAEYDVIGTYIEEFNNYDQTTVLRKVPLTEKKIMERILFSNPMNHVSVIFKASLLEKYKDPDFYPLIDGFEDYALWIKLLSKKVKIKNLPIISVKVRAANEMLERRGGIRYIFGEMKFRTLILKYIPIHKYPENFFYAFLRIIVFSSPSFLKKIFYRIKRKY
tara:strand:+ start:16143 stop:16967 length:825 start_codon:yes stop_codon:yes gene_type:complete